MKSYKFSYWLSGGRGGLAIVEASNSINVEQLVNAIKKNFLERGIDVGEIQVEEFREITNPIDKFIINLEISGFIK